VVLDLRLSFDQQIDAVCKACYFHIRALRHVRDSLPDDVAITVACSIVSSRLDYCNALYAGISAKNFDKLQRVQNTIARVILRLRKYDHITPALVQLHWLPIRQRVTFKLICLHTQQPAYLHELINRYQPARQLRSSEHTGLID
jgi:predicted DsbA family dithiol-disulfide isomerase